MGCITEWNDMATSIPAVRGGGIGPALLETFVRVDRARFEYGMVFTNVLLVGLARSDELGELLVFTNVYVEGLARGDELGELRWGEVFVSVPMARGSGISASPRA